MQTYIYSMYIEDKKSDPAYIIYTCKTTCHTKFHDLIREIEFDIQRMVIAEYHSTKPEYPFVKFYKYPSFEEFQYLKDPIKTLTIEYDGGIYVSEHFISKLEENYTSFIMQCNKNNYLFKVDEFNV